jgi:bleomycin hydrolase
LDFHAEDYIELTSFMHHPFGESFVLEVPDNWEHAPFYNVPIDSMEAYVQRAIRNGQTVAWDGDISEKSFLARSGVAIYSDSLVTQQERQEGFEKFETTDDHMMHIVGTAYDKEGKFYYILKNSWGRVGPYEGLIYMSKEYFRAKTISVVLFRESLN